MLRAEVRVLPRRGPGAEGRQEPHVREHHVGSCALLRQTLRDFQMELCSRAVSAHVTLPDEFTTCQQPQVCLSAFWIAVDADLNDAAVLIDADPVFQIMENVFCRLGCS